MSARTGWQAYEFVLRRGYIPGRTSDHGCLGTFFNNYRDTNDGILVRMANTAFPEDEVWRVPSAAKGESRPS